MDMMFQNPTILAKTAQVAAVAQPLTARLGDSDES